MFIVLDEGTAKEVAHPSTSSASINDYNCGLDITT